MTKPSNEKKKITSKQVVAILGVVALVLLYVVTLLAAIFDTDAQGGLFMVCLIATFTIPLLIWVYTWLYGKLTGKHTIASFDLGGKETNDDL